jgi:hypothetical protein
MSAVGDAKRLFFEGLAYLDDQNFSAAQHKQKKVDDAALTSTRAIEIDPKQYRSALRAGVRSDPAMHALVAKYQAAQKAYLDLCKLMEALSTLG